MGYGAYMTIENNSSNQITTYVTGVSCMWDNNNQGSNISFFNDLAIEGTTSAPSSGRQYIEAKNSGSCFFDDATFSINVTTDSGGTEVGTISFTDSGDNWTSTQTGTPGYISVLIINTDQQATITVTVISTGGSTGG